MKKLRGHTPESRVEPDDLVKAIDVLLPHLLPVAALSLNVRVEDVRPVSTAEVDAAIECSL